MVTNSPPVGAAAGPPFIAGIGMIPYSKPAFLALDSCQVPFSPNAYWPVANSCQLVVWGLVSTSFGARPSDTQPFHSDSAAWPAALSRWVRSPFAPQNQGRNWKLPSSVPIAE